MEHYLHNVVEVLVDVIQSVHPLLGILLSGSIIVLESLIPVLPLAVFITLNQLVFGFAFGFLFSYLFHVLGCLVSFSICRKGVRKFLDRHIKNQKQLELLENRITSVNFFSFVVIVALPFTPSFLVNIAAGISNISYKKFMAGILIGKVFIIYFWGTVGTSLVESFQNPLIVLRIGIMMLGAFVISKIVSHVFEIK